MKQAGAPITLSTMTLSAIDSLQLIHAIDMFASARVLILGDVMLDEYLTGDAERISPEAPVPVVRVEESSHLSGGAGNVARNITALGGKTLLIGIRGEDAAGAELERCLDRESISHALLPLHTRPTTMKTRVLARQQQVIRIDREHSGPLSARQVRSLMELVAKELPKYDAVVLSDYGKGIVCKTAMKALWQLLEEQERHIPLLIDPKPLNFSLYKGATLITPNAKETMESVNMPVDTPKNIIRAGREILKRLGSDHLVTTLGAKGMTVFENKNSIYHIPTSAKQVFDVTGAGDTVISVLALAAAQQIPLVPAALLANYAAGIVIGKIGAATVRPNQLAEVVALHPNHNVEKWAS